MKCEFTGCRGLVAWECRRLWGNGGTIYTCDKHKPGAKRPDSLKHLPTYYDCKPVAAGK